MFFFVAKKNGDFLSPKNPGQDLHLLQLLLPGDLSLLAALLQLLLQQDDDTRATSHLVPAPTFFCDFWLVLEVKMVG